MRSKRLDIKQGVRIVFLLLGSIFFFIGGITVCLIEQGGVHPYNLLGCFLIVLGGMSLLGVVVVAPLKSTV